MTNKELINYLELFSDDAEISMVVANPAKDVRLYYPVEEVFLVSKMERSALLVQVGKGKDMDEEGEEV